MNNLQIPSYPSVHATVHPDGSAHVNAAGDHQDYPTAELDETRERVLAYATAVATRLGRAVRMTTIDPGGEWKLGVYPDGTVVDLAPPPVKARADAKRRARRSPARGITGILLASLPVPKRPGPTGTKRAKKLAIRGQAIAKMPWVPATRVATLRFSTGDTAIIGPPAIIGRNPQSVVGNTGGSQLVVLTDLNRTLSRAHADVAWVDAKLTVTDRGAGNGTAVVRAPKGRVELVSGEPHELLDGDVLHLGADVTCAISIGPRRGRGRK